ncbi:MAG TPA: hypothetical protein VLM75_07250 [Spirochaetota bacterium]|nr:hypothetical protein [Spirochaetota bacterium]
MRIPLIIIITAVAVLSCARERSGSLRVSPVKDGPGETLVHIIDMANQNRIEEVSSSITYTLVADFDENLRVRGTDDWSQSGKRAFWNRLTRDCSIRDVLLRDERISGEFAFVRCRLVYRDGGAEDIQAEMKMTGSGNWVLFVYPAMLRR